MTGSKLDRYWIAAFSKKELCKCCCFGRHTIDDIFRIISWSFQVLLNGVFPKYDHEDKELTHPYRTIRTGCSLMDRGACIGSAGDWVWYKVALNLAGWKGEGESKRCCWLCKATLSDPTPAF